MPRRERPAQPRRAPLTVTRKELLADGSDAKFRQLVHNLFAVAARHETVRAGHGARIGLSGIEYTFLISVLHLGEAGPVNVKALGEHLHVSGAFATTMAGRLIEQGLLRKSVDPDDRRRVRLALTDPGFRLLQELAPVQQRVNDVQFGCLDEREFHLLADLLERLIRSSEDAAALQDYLRRTG